MKSLVRLSFTCGPPLPCTSVSGLSCKWICLENERNERQREEWEMELIARGHGDNDFFMDPVGVEWPWRLVLVFFFSLGKESEWMWGWTLHGTGAFTEYVNAFFFLRQRPTCQQRFQMTHFVFTQCKFAHRVVRSRWLSGAPHMLDKRTYNLLMISKHCDT